MSAQRGDVVLIDHPYSTGVGSKKRPVLVIQNDRDNGRLNSTVVAQITSTTYRATLEATQLFIDLNTTDGQQSGLKYDSVVNCVNLFTVHQSKILRKLGSLSTPLMQQVATCLKAALDLP
jgi:mRNA interferase MazF